jgi:hypothetical protein
MHTFIFRAPKRREIEPDEESPTPLKPMQPEIDPDHWHEEPTEPNRNIPEREAEPFEPPTVPGQSIPEFNGRRSAKKRSKKNRPLKIDFFLKTHFLFIA